jgi:Sortase and related acyltransferases
MLIKDGAFYIAEVKNLIREYYLYLERDLSFQDIASELEDPMKKYSPPHGELLVALDGNKVIGMGAYKRLSDGVCEMKRLYVRPEARGKGLGKALAERLVDDAGKAGYREMVLDTILPLKAAISLYRALGFCECEAYYHNPMKDVIYMRKYLVRQTG